MEFTSFDLLDGEDVVDQLDDIVRPISNDLQALLLPLVERPQCAVQQQLDVCFDERERGAQLV